MTLTQTAIITKKVIAVSIAALMLTIFSFIGYKIWYFYYITNLPPVEEKPDTKFGLLPAPDFPDSAVSSSNFSYSLDTITGGLPRVGTDPGFEKIIKVYFVTQTFATLLAPEKSQNLADKFDIDTPPDILSETKYRFSRQDKTLIVDLDTGNFSYTKEASVSGKVTLDDDNKLISDFLQTLSRLGLVNDVFKEGRTKVVLLRSAGKELVNTKLRSEAIAAQVSLWPGAIDKKPVFTESYNQSLVNAVVLGGSDNLEDYLTLDFTSHPVDTQTFATYPVKTAEAAFEDLKNGKGVVVVEPDKPQVSITSVYLGYYLAKNYSPYLLPIFVFEGPDFVAYVPAIDNEFQSPLQ